MEFGVFFFFFFFFGGGGGGRNKVAVRYFYSSYVCIFSPKRVTLIIFGKGSI